ncbi:MAG: hypothetical protein HFF47_10955 [Lawsonibacter sp.]|jgi:ABC-2 type transport system permease protein|nr:hypothetical protein [Lawsonibacter sp.]
MRSATSYFNGPLYRKTLARFWPLWGLWGVMWLFALPLNMLSDYFSRYLDSAPQRRLLSMALHLPDFLRPLLAFTLLFALLCAMAVFGYLYSHRSACWTHALPMRREALFTTQYLAGLSMLILPQLAACLLAAIVELSFLPLEDWGAVLPPLLILALAQSGLSLFFFSFASFCAMFTGHILALPAFYIILNCLSYGLWFLIDALLSEFYYGYAGIPGALEVVECLAPYIILSQASDWWGEPASLRAPGVIAVYAAIGVGLALISLYVYRRRHVETAGDVVSVALVRPLFKYGVSFCAGLAFGMFTSAFFGWAELPALIPCILFWTVTGCFAAEMLLKKSFRVFKAWRGAAAMAAVMLVLCLACFLDLFGVVERVPDPAQVESVLVNIDMGYPFDHGQTLSADISDPGQLELISALHQAIVDNRDDEGQGCSSESDYISADFLYRLPNGSQVNRRYRGVPISAEDLNVPGTVTHAMEQIVEDRELVALAYHFDSFLEDGRLTGAWLDQIFDYRGESVYHVYVDDYAQELWDAVQADFAQGNIGVRSLFDRDSLGNTAELVFSVTAYQRTDGPGSVQVSPGGYNIDRTLSIAFTDQARHTLAALEKTGIWAEGYTLDRPEP